MFPTRTGHPERPGRAIAKMKYGTTHLADKAEHAVDLDTEVILAAELSYCDLAARPRWKSSRAWQAVKWSRSTHGTSQMAEIVAVKGYHKAETLARPTDGGDSR